MNPLKSLGAIFFAIGAIMLAVAFFPWINSAGFAAHATTADGVVTGLAHRVSGRGYAPVVEFTTADGHLQSITGSVSTSPPAYTVGEHVRVLYDATSPENARIDSKLEALFGPLLIGGLGCLFATIGGGFLAYVVRTRRLREWLALNGHRVKAKYAGVIRDARITVNGRHPWRLMAQWRSPVTQTEYVFRSDPISFDPTEFVKRDQLDVTMNPDNPRQYVIDTSFLHH